MGAKGLKTGVEFVRCKDCNKYNKAIDMYNMFDWKKHHGVMSFDKKTEEILISEEGLMRIIQMVNPMQEVRKIRLVSKEAIKDGTS